jgi:hypothetical protein
MAEDSSQEETITLALKIGHSFALRDFVQCSEAWKNLDSQGVAPANVPQSMDTIREMKRLAADVLDPVVARFQTVELTYGFCVPPLTRHIGKRIEPRVDQHAGHELNRRGKRICERDGFAVDFQVPGIDSLQVAQFVARECSFDRLYFYERHLPIHVSASPTPQGKVVRVHRPESGFVRPHTMNRDSFLNWIRKEIT